MDFCHGLNASLGSYPVLTVLLLSLAICIYDARWGDPPCSMSQDLPTFYERGKEEMKQREGGVNSIKLIALILISMLYFNRVETLFCPNFPGHTPCTLFCCFCWTFVYTTHELYCASALWGDPPRSMSQHLPTFYERGKGELKKEKTQSKFNIIESTYIDFNAEFQSNLDPVLPQFFRAHAQHEVQEALHPLVDGAP